MADISSGSLDATTGIKALLDGMAKFPGAAGAMEAQSKTLLGVFSTIESLAGRQRIRFLESSTRSMSSKRSSGTTGRCS